jgi:sterol O-acyltransferase
MLVCSTLLLGALASQWNTTSFSSYYRKWNLLVHDSLYNYIYVDLRRFGCPQGICFFLTFLVSAIVHEYIISVAMGFFYPVLLIMFIGPCTTTVGQQRVC